MSFELDKPSMSFELDNAMATLLKVVPSVVLLIVCGQRSTSMLLVAMCHVKSRCASAPCAPSTEEVLDRRVTIGEEDASQFN
jgi:hypothetical protein